MAETGATAARPAATQRVKATMSEEAGRAIAARISMMTTELEHSVQPKPAYEKVKDPAYFNRFCENYLPGLLGIQMTLVNEQEVRAEMVITKAHLAPNGYLHAGSVVTLADTSCGIGCIANLPEGASGFTTVELKSNHLGTLLDGILECIATPVHKGRTTQVWDATVFSKGTGKAIALFRCTQMILYPKND